MRKAILIALLLMLSALMVVSLPAQTKRKTKKHTPDPKESPCGVLIPSFQDFVEEVKVEWRVATASKEAMYFYNTHRVTCGSEGILSAWIKGTYDDEGKSIANMSRYEFKCRSNQLRITSQTEYYKDGRVKSSEIYKNPEWGEVIPDSVGERVLEKLCRKRL